MSSYNLLFFLSLILSTLFVNHALALYKEEIVGGYAAFQPNHKYHAAIIGKYNKSDARYILCSGGIIGDFFILSAAHCFMKGFNILKKTAFFALVGSVNIRVQEPPAKEIDRIYRAGLGHEEFSNDLAVSKLKESLQLGSNPHLSKLKIPYPNVKYIRRGVVTGFGNNISNPVRATTSFRRLRISGRTSRLLTYVFVEISDDEVCKAAYGHINKLLHLCGIVRPDYRNRRRGLCKGDGGAPLVDNDEIVIGIATQHNEDCDDTEKGAIYVNVAYYKEFIDAIMSETYINTIVTPVVYENIPHIAYAY